MTPEPHRLGGRLVGLAVFLVASTQALAQLPSPAAGWIVTRPRSKATFGVIPAAFILDGRMGIPSGDPTGYGIREFLPVELKSQLRFDVLLTRRQVREVLLGLSPGNPQFHAEALVTGVRGDVQTEPGTSD